MQQARDSIVSDEVRNSTSRDAEICFDRAIATSREQGTKSLELRAVTSLSSLLSARGKSDEAQKMLSEVYGWFTEGFDTPDLKRAKTLLEELS